MEVKINMEKNFKKTYLKTGDKVVYRDGRELIVMLNTVDGDLLFGYNSTDDNWDYLSDKSDDLKSVHCHSNLDIVEVYRSHSRYLFINGIEVEWELIRKESTEPVVMELTMSEVNEKFGCTCKIVGGK